MEYVSNFQTDSSLAVDFEDIGERISNALRTRSDDQSGIHFESWSLLTDNGFWSLGLPQNAEDTLSWERLSDAVEQLAKGTGDLGFVLSAIAHVGIVRMVHLYGSQDQKATFLPRLLRGEVAAMAITELGGGSDVPRIELTACPDVGGFSLTGHKAHITNAPDSKIVLAVGRRSDQETRENICLFLIDTESDEIQIGENETMIGHHGSSTGDLVFSGHKLTEDDILQAGANGLAATYAMIAFDRALYGLAAAACLVPLMKGAMVRVHERNSFGQPLHKHQLVQQRIVEANTAFVSGRALARQAVHAFLCNDPESLMLCSTAKLVCTEGFLTGARNLMMVMGHKGYETGSYASAFCDAAGSCIAAGTSDIQTVNIFNHLARLHEAAYPTARL